MPSSSDAAKRAAVGSRRRPFRSLRGRDAFSRVYEEGDRRRRGDLTLVIAPGARGFPQVGFVAGRRVGNAVARNRAKRRLRAAMADVGLTDDTTYVVIAGPGVVDVAYERLVGWLEAAIAMGDVKKEEAT